MEVAGVVFRQAPCFSSNSSVNFRSFSPKQQWSRKSVIALAGCDEFSDKSHLQYYDYNGGPRMSMKEKEMKKQLKLVKGLSKNLARFGDMGFGLNLNVNDGLDEQVRGKMISEATEVLVGQLQKLKAEKMELKRRKKEEKAKKKAAKMMECKSKKESSSSSSSSESECEKLALSQLLASPSAIETATTTVIESPSSMVEEVENNMNMKMQSKRVGDKIEVCMGGKCKKSGAAVLLENFQKAVGGGEAAALVVGCKCMGKCRDGPNVKVGNGNGNPLCIGVGLEDVDSIVNDFLFGQNTMGAPAPALAL
ncbi:diacylglycerol O-acyltransferase 3, cytosolic [Cynara cardunculus var. scolymus]|nr:diacylglycerol O-acyltransferase 3, cytosolic [Cynara cardunculus var. scolymus]